jgi:hypothetical protein
MHKSATKCNETLGKWCKNKHGASKIMDTLETYQGAESMNHHCRGRSSRENYCKDNTPRDNREKSSKIDLSKQDPKNHT